MMTRLAKHPKTLTRLVTRTDLAAALRASERHIAEIVSNPANHYGYLPLPKPDGSIRKIYPPNRKLRALQRAFLEMLYGRLRAPSYLHGGIPGRSTITHAKYHVGAEMVATLDVKDFFPSTSDSAVSPVLAEAGFEDEALADALRLSMFRGGLPQGSPVSCLLANLAFCDVDLRIRRICRQRGLIYSRYVDDIAISGPGDFRELKGPFIECIRSGGYEVALRKVLFQSSAARQVVTGLVVNDKLRPTREFVRDLKHAIRLCIEHGASWVAAVEGLRVGELKARLNGRASHVLPM